MVKGRPLLVALPLVLALIVGAAVAQTRTYRLNQEWAKIWIRKNGTIDLFYNISMTLVSGAEINWVFIGQPQRDFTIIESADQYGNELWTSDESSGDDYKVQVRLNSSLTAGQTVWFTLTTNVAHMIYDDEEQNPGNAGMEFVPTWWSEAIVSDLRVSVVLPSGVTVDQVRTLRGADWNRTFYEEDRLVVYWEKQNLLPDEQFPVGVSFPKEYVDYYDPRPSGFVTFLERYGSVLLIFGFFVVVIGSVLYAARKSSYLKPMISMESLGVRRGLTAVEASYLLEMPPTRIVTEILFSLLKKRAIWVDSTSPSLKLKVMKQSQDEPGTAETPLRYYEIDFLDAIRKDGTLDEEKLAHTVTYLRDTVEQKMHGYCRRDTTDYYRRIVEKAWEQVEQAGTPEVASKAYDEQLLWLLLDPNCQSRTKEGFRDKAFEPSPFWFWYWYSYQHYHPSPAYKPKLETPAQSAKPPTIPGAEFANNIATAVESTSNKIVADIEKFANAIIPVPTAKASSEPARKGASCVCACAACACACACVSCACACAGGGVG